MKIREDPKFIKFDVLSFCHVGFPIQRLGEVQSYE